jgi:hypothetical protein
LNIFKQSISILGDLYIISCFLAANKSLHRGHRQELSAVKVSVFSNAEKQSIRLATKLSVGDLILGLM